jgi:hypothetical protein
MMIAAPIQVVAGGRSAKISQPSSTAQSSCA